MWKAGQDVTLKRIKLYAELTITRPEQSAVMQLLGGFADALRLVAAMTEKNLVSFG